MGTDMEFARHARLHGAGGGHYESWFLRANHPTEPRAFWIRYTLFVPAEPEEPRLGEVWAIYFDGGKPIAAQQDVPWSQCHVAAAGLDVRLGESILLPGDARGCARSTHRLEWQLRYEGREEPLLLLPAARYGRSFPKAKALVSCPLARFSGKIAVDGETIVIDDWIGSENHNWGERHTDSYAWGQVCGFDHDETAFLECASARLKLGPLWSPVMTLAVLRYEGQVFQFNRLERAWRQKAKYEPGSWTFVCTEGDARLHVSMNARADDIVALRYRNPPGGVKTCLNSKLASCDALLERRGFPSVRLHSAHGAAFEILTDLPPEGGRYAN